MQGRREGGSPAIERAAEEPPKDAYNLAYIIHLLLGVSYLMPWNVFITAVDYFSFLYPGDHVDRAFAVAYMGASLAALLALVGSARWAHLRPSLRGRVNAGLAVFVACLLVAPMMDLVGARDYAGMVAAVAVCGLADGLVGGSLVGSTGALPGRYMQAIFLGTAASGVLVTILRIITKASLPQTPQGLKTSTHLYFIVSIAIEILCIISFNVLEKLPVVRYYRRQTLPHRRNSPDTKTSDTSDAKPQFWGIWKKIRWSAFGVCALYVVTLSIFPGFITENVRSEFLKDWYPILLITAYNVSDCVGKSITAIYVPKSATGTNWACLARFAFYPLFALCLHGPKAFRTELPVVVLTSALGLSNGYLTSVIMILAPKSVTPIESETAGTVVLSFLGIGLAVGPVIGWFWVI